MASMIQRGNSKQRQDSMVDFGILQGDPLSLNSLPPGKVV
jgi:hypothetical protein